MLDRSLTMPRHKLTGPIDATLLLLSRSLHCRSTDFCCSHCIPPSMGKPTPAAVDKVLDVPTVSFRIITDDKSLLGPAGVHSVG